MCGIVGLQGNFSRELLDAMSLAVAHRGPDGSGAVWLREFGAPTGLAHRRLAIIDLSEAGAQPMTVDADAGGNMQRGLTLVFNGEIYNYQELRADLAAAGHRFRTATDSEVLLHLYERDGLSLLEKLNGIFAFAIHDARAQGRPAGVDRGALFIARDHLGVKPLYFSEVASGFIFGSEMSAITCHDGVSRAVDPAALTQMLAYLWTPAPRTMLSGVKKLEPGCALVVHEGKVRRHWRYYVVPYNGETDSRDFNTLSTELADRVATAVKRQLVADVPVGAFLSGGLDSSAIVAMMRKAHRDRKIQCFSIGFLDSNDVEGNPADIPYARRVARYLDVDLEEVIMEPSAIDRLDEMVALLGEPQADPAPINALMISERARAMGIPVLLSGAGGDDLFSGYRRHRALGMERYWDWLPQRIRMLGQVAAQNAASGNGRLQSKTAFRRAAKMFAYAGESAERRLISYFYWSTDRVRRSLLSPEFASLTKSLDVAEPLIRSLELIKAERDPLQRMLFLETRHFLPDHNLNYTDRAGMAVGVEIRVPLLDLDLVQFATRVPSGFKQRGSVGKAIFKKAMEPYLPRDVIYRQKSGFGAPLRRWLRHELKPRVQDTLDPATIRRRGFFDPDAVSRLVELDRLGAIDGSYTIFALMCFELWCRRFVDRS